MLSKAVAFVQLSQSLDEYVEYIQCHDIHQNFVNRRAHFFKFLKKRGYMELLTFCKNSLEKNPVSFYYQYKFNYKWFIMSESAWIANANHPCPIITITDQHQRINNFEGEVGGEDILIDEAVMKAKLLNTKAFFAKSNGNLIRFQSKIDKAILKPKRKHLYIHFDTSQISLKEILNSKLRPGTCYYLNYQDNDNKYIVKNLNLVIQICCITQRYLRVKNNKTSNNNKNKGSTKITGSKIKLQIVIKQRDWQKYPPIFKLYFYKLSQFVSHLIMNENHIIGYHHYYYQYECYDAIDTNNEHISHYYLNYTPSKPIASIQNFYTEYRNNAKMQKYFLYCQQNTTTRNGFDEVCDVGHNHRFWIGMSAHRNVLNNYWQNKIYSIISGWKNNNRVPNGICVDKCKNRWKFFIFYRYFYRLKNMTTSQINKQSAIAGGLRNIDNMYVPSFITKLIKFLKGKFIDSNIEINQVGINYYFNHGKMTSIYTGIDPHKEENKFSVVYCISIYSNPSNPTSLSFNLLCNKSCGDAKVLMKHNVGYKLRSFVFFLCLYIYIQTYILYIYIQFQVGV